MKSSNSKLNLFLFVIISLLGILTILPLLSKIPSHPDEYQFYLNAFEMMAGKELSTYIHGGLTEYFLTGYFYLVNLFTESGINFPQGDVSLVAHYYGKIFSFGLYILTFFLSCLLLQRNEKKIKLRTVFFAALYFSSIGFMERFLRVNSEAMSVFVFLNFMIFSFLFHRQKASVVKFFFLNLIFIFLASFSNLKALYLILPLAFFNTVFPFLWYEKDVKDKIRLPKIYRFVFYCLGILYGGVILWVVFMPKPFNSRVFWYSIKHTILYAAKFDFNYPTCAFGSWKVYLYDLLMEYIGLPTALAIIFLSLLSYIISRKFAGQNLFRLLFTKAKSQIKLDYFKNGNLDKMTEFILLLSFISFYIGLSSQTIHWSRWGVPLGILAIMILSTVLEKVLEPLLIYNEKTKIKLSVLLPVLFIISWLLRIFLSVDIYRSAFNSSVPYINTKNDLAKFLEEKNIKPEDGLKKVAWVAVPYTTNVGVISWDQLVDQNFDKRKDIEYILWPSWDIGPVYTKRNVDLQTHNQRALIEQMTKEVSYRFPSIISVYVHYTKLFAWKYLGLTWNPEVENMIEPVYGVLKLKKPLDIFKVVYTIPFKDMSHYYFPYSLIFNIKNLPDGYMFPTCYGYTNVRNVSDGLLVEAPPELGPGGRTANLYCHCAWFRVFFRGTYNIQVEGLPDDPQGVQKVFSNLVFDWNYKTRTISLSVPDTSLVISFGIAARERNLPKLKFVVNYRSPVSP